MNTVARAATIVALMALTGCGLLPVRTVHDHCIIDKPIRLLESEPALLSQGSNEQILAHNETGKSVCGWKNK